MDTRAGIGGTPSDRKTRSWYPGGQAPTRRSTARAAAAWPGRSVGPGANVGYWGRVNTQGDFEEGTGFLTPLSPSRFPWRLLFRTVQRILPLGLAALVGAVTALAWQSHMTGPAKGAAPRPASVIPAEHGARSVGTAGATESGTTDLPSVYRQAPTLPTPAAARPAPLLLLGSAPAPSPARPSAVVTGSASARPSASAIDPRPATSTPRPAAVKTKVKRAARAVAPTRHVRPADPDAVLPPSFM
jgi:hypothetical protein